MRALPLLALSGLLASALFGSGAQSFANGRGRAVAPPAADSAAGTALYLKGVLASGEPLVGVRVGSEPLRGDQAACANCHRHSGLGSQEGRSIIPPISGQFLFQAPAGSREDTELPFVLGARPDRKPYSAETLARAIREGIDSEGRSMSPLMPRYEVSDQDMAALIAHLRALDRRQVPGVSDTELHFATIITPDADPLQRRGVLDVLEHFFADRNNTQRLPSSQSMLPSGNAFRVKGMFKVTRRWVLHVWEPKGPKSTWTAQLQKDFAERPVFAVLSGLGGEDWQPVQTFCEQQAVPCLFPNVALPPPDAENEFYSMYFSRGVRLEADLIAQALLQPAAGQPAVKEVREIYREGDIGAAAAAALAATLQPAGVHVVLRALARGAAPKAVVAAVREAAAGGTLVLWLRPPDLESLAAIDPAGAVYVSGIMSNIDAKPLPDGWRGAHVAYPFDLPEARRVRVDYARGWFRIRNIALVDEQVQADTYLACGLASETLKHMVDTFVPDYLIERLEDTTEHRIITGYYPRLSLGPHQRFASKGGFLVHFDPAAQGGAVPEGPWTAP